MTRPDKREAALETIRRIGIVPVIRAQTADAAFAVAEALIGAGLAIAEVTMTVPGALDVITSISRRFGDRVLVGAGTVTDVTTAKRAIDLGAQFIVTPCLVPEVIEATLKKDVAILPGALTPTEVFTAHRLGGDMVKVFPVGVGGAPYVRALRGPFPTIPLVPTGGITLDNVRDMFDAGAAAVGVGSELISRDALARQDYAAIGRMAQMFLAASHPGRGATV
ncbi:MAG: bifunctional 4-hydroxy-2-oxoglutarate aldolase/2-dehydro-3-deoxy-phosphogluconate aldolase [Gemmatimonadaceae bacterium]